MVNKVKRSLQLIGVIILGIFLVATVIGFARDSSERVLAAAGPIAPPVGYPKLSLSTKVVTPTLADPSLGAPVLVYNIEILNTGAYTAYNVTLTDAIPVSTTYKYDATPCGTHAPAYKDGVLTWHCVVGFDDSETVSFSVKVDSGFEGLVANTAVINDPMILEPVTVTAEARVTDHPVFEISKTAKPDLPGKNKPLTYELTVTNVGQEANDTPINVTDFIPAHTTFLDASGNGKYSPADKVVTWDTNVSLATGATSVFTFSVQVGNVPSGTVIANENYSVVGAGEFGVGAPYTSTVVDPILLISKSIYPDPPGANTEMTYTLTVLNLGSQATDLVITDKVPVGLTYVSGGTYSGEPDRIVTWKLPSLDSHESAQVSFVVRSGDVANVIVLNEQYEVCSKEGVCAQGIPVPSLLVGPTFEVTADVYPIAKKPGGGSVNEQKILPTLTIRNLGPGNAIDAKALLTFGNISVSQDAVFLVEPPGSGPVVEGPLCTVWTHCLHYLWTGNMDVGDVITITTDEPQSTIGGDEWTPYTATLVITDVLGTYVTEPVSDTAIGHITHMSNLIPIKSAPPEIGPGQTLSYTIKVVNSGLSTEATPSLTETIPANVTLNVGSISDGGTYETVGDRTIVSWELPQMSTGDTLSRSFAVTTDPGLVSGTLIVNDDYQTSVYEDWIKGLKIVPGEPVTTTIHEVGLIDSYKVVSPTWALPDVGTVLTYVVHVVNSGPELLDDVVVSDIFPWEHTTYQHDAVATSGSLSDNIISFLWKGDLTPYSEELITFTTVVDPFFEGVVTNTATISDDSLTEDKVVKAVAYITDEPVLRISKAATPDPVKVNGTLLYQIEVENLGYTAYQLTVTDTLPVRTEYVPGSASAGGTVVGGVVTWLNTPLVLYHGGTERLTFQVKVLGGHEVVNDRYAVCTAQGVCAYGDPVVTKVLVNEILLPLIYKK